MWVVIGAWNIDPDRMAAAREQLLAHIVPGVRHAPGLVKGYWAEQNARSHTFIVFQDREAADAFAGDVRKNTASQAEHGVDAVDIAVYEIVAET
ncbi:hypothetical protein ACVBEQ_17845 [Nakamurella sp. GG22]